MDLNVDSPCSLFNGTLNELPFDILGVIFSLILSENTQTNRNGTLATRTQLATVSKNISSFVRVTTNTFDDIFTSSLNLITEHSPQYLKFIFNRDRHLLPFSYFQGYSFEEFVERVLMTDLVLDGIVNTSSFFMDYIDYLADTNSLTFVLAESVFSEFSFHSLKGTTGLRVLSALFKGRTSCTVLRYVDYKMNFVGLLDIMTSNPSIITREEYDLCITVYKEFFFAWRQELTSIYREMVDDMIISRNLTDTFFNNLNSMSMDTICGFELVNVYRDFIPSQFFISGINEHTDLFVQIPVPCFKDSDCTEQVFGFRRYNFNVVTSNYNEEDYYYDQVYDYDDDDEQYYDEDDNGQYYDDDEDLDDDYYHRQETACCPIYM